MSVVKSIPEGHAAVTPYLNIRDAAKAIDFYKKVFGATEYMRMPFPDGKIMHAQITVGNSMIMLADETEMMGNKSPLTLQGTAVSFYLYVSDVDAVVNLAVQEGATILLPLENRFYGDRVSIVRDPFGHVWSVATHIEDVTLEESKKRAAALFAAK